MNKNLVHFVSGIETISKRKHIFYLSKSGYSVVKTSTIPELLESLKSQSPLCIILQTLEDLKLVSSTTTEYPLLILLSSGTNFAPLYKEYQNFSNILLFRQDTESLATIAETVNLIGQFDKQTQTG